MTAARSRWERTAEWPLTAAALLFLAAYAWPILDPTLSGAWVNACRVVAWATWALFAVDYLARLALSADRVTFVRRHALVLGASELRELQRGSLQRSHTESDARIGDT